MNNKYYQNALASGSVNAGIPYDSYYRALVDRNKPSEPQQYQSSDIPADLRSDMYKKETEDPQFASALASYYARRKNREGYITPKQRTLAVGDSVQVDGMPINDWVPQTPESSYVIADQPPVATASPTPMDIPYEQTPQAQSSVGWQDFVQKAKEIADKTGFPLGVLLGQAALETGRNPNSAPGHNWFGIKGRGTAGSQNLATKEQGENGLFDTSGNFRAYNSPDESIMDYINLIKNTPRYKKAWALRDNPIEMLNAIKNAGYATDAAYVQKVSATPEFRANMKQAPTITPTVVQQAITKAPIKNSTYQGLSKVNGKDVPVYSVAAGAKERIPTSNLTKDQINKQLALAKRKPEQILYDQLFGNGFKAIGDVVNLLKKKK